MLMLINLMFGAGGMEAFVYWNSSRGGEAYFQSLSLPRALASLLWLERGKVSPHIENFTPNYTFKGRQLPLGLMVLLN